MSNDKRVRRAHFADDMWYSGREAQLQQDVAGYMRQNPPPPDLGRVVGLAAPHAGYAYSGHVAGAAFNSLAAADFESVVLLGPDHRGATMGRIATVGVDAWRTPLGEVSVDWELLEAIEADIPLKKLSDDEEHSLEVELPFLQVRLERFKLAPLLMGDQSPATCRQLGEAIARAAGNSQPLLVASSDLSHFYDDETARRLDQETLQFALDMDADGLAEHAENARRRGQPLACGAGAIATVIHAAKAMGANRARLIKYATSGDVHPRKDRVVGYAAVAFTQ